MQREVDEGDRPAPPTAVDSRDGLPVLDQFADSRVVIIDDEPANIELLDRILRRQGLQQLSAFTDSSEAMARIGELDPDLVLVDLHMPGVDGYGVLTRLREQAAGSYLPVLVLTADTTRQAIRRALACGARDFISKPFDIVEALLRVRNLLETRALHTVLRHHNVALREQLGDYQQAAEAQRETDLQTAERIRRVIAGDDPMAMVFQPIVVVGDGTVVGCEALARFPHEPAFGPDRWFADAEHVGLGLGLELSAVRAALRQLDEIPAELFMTVNVSPATVLSGELDAVLAQVDPGRIVLELTEHVPVEDYEAVNRALAAPRERGVRLALDDTGAGYAGFRHLLGLKPDIIKLDISLTRDVDRDAGRRALAAALMAFSHDVGAQVIAEGVENAGELDALALLGLPWVQGFHVGRPVAAADLVASVTVPTRS